MSMYVLTLVNALAEFAFFCAVKNKPSVFPFLVCCKWH